MQLVGRNFVPPETEKLEQVDRKRHNIFWRFMATWYLVFMFVIWQIFWNNSSEITWLTTKWVILCIHVCHMAEDILRFQGPMADSEPQSKWVHFAPSAKCLKKFLPPPRPLFGFTGQFLIFTWPISYLTKWLDILWSFIITKLSLWKGITKQRGHNISQKKCVKKIWADSLSRK